MCLLCSACSVAILSHLFLQRENTMFTWRWRGVCACVCVCVGGTSFQTIRWKRSTWSRLIRFLVLSPAPNQPQRGSLSVSVLARYRVKSHYVTLTSFCRQWHRSINGNLVMYRHSLWEKNYGFTPNLDFNPAFTKFNFTEFLHTKPTPENMQHIKRKEN